jgi:glutamine phosphoribosylpyrophosphate amidotransferase
MCGIVGYVGRRPGKPIILDGLRRLEYRGYDSAGIVLIEDGGLETVRSVGNLDALFAAAGENSSKATVGLGHTRWATHGRPSYENAHPHDDCTGKASIVVVRLREVGSAGMKTAHGGQRALPALIERDSRFTAHILVDGVADDRRHGDRAFARQPLHGCGLVLTELDLRAHHVVTPKCNHIAITC